MARRRTWLFSLLESLRSVLNSFQDELTGMMPDQHASSSSAAMKGQKKQRPPPLDVETNMMPPPTLPTPLNGISSLHTVPLVLQPSQASWDLKEQSQLDRISRQMCFPRESLVNRSIKIAAFLRTKTVRDVASRLKLMEDTEALRMHEVDEVEGLLQRCDTILNELQSIPQVHRTSQQNQAMLELMNEFVDLSSKVKEALDSRELKIPVHLISVPSLSPELPPNTMTEPNAAPTQEQMSHHLAPSVQQVPGLMQAEVSSNELPAPESVHVENNQSVEVDIKHDPHEKPAITDGNVDDEHPADHVAVNNSLEKKAEPATNESTIGQEQVPSKGMTESVAPEEILSGHLLKDESSCFASELGSLPAKDNDTNTIGLAGNVLNNLNPPPRPDSVYSSEERFKSSMPSS